MLLIWNVYKAFRSFFFLLFFRSCFLNLSNAQRRKGNLLLEDSAGWKTSFEANTSSQSRTDFSSKVAQYQNVECTRQKTWAVLNSGSMWSSQCLSKVNNFFPLRAFYLFFSQNGNDNYHREWTWPPPFISCVWRSTDSITQPLFSLWILPMAIKIETISSTMELTPLNTFIQRWGCQKTAKLQKVSLWAHTLLFEHI